MPKVLLSVASIVVICFLPVWIFLISPEYLKLPSNFSSKANMVHTENNRFDINSVWEGKTIAISSSNINTTSADSKTARVDTQFKVESLTGETLFELNQKYIIDRLTRRNLAGGNDTNGKAFVLFSPNPSKKELTFWPAEMGAPTKIFYIGDSLVNKLPVYHYQAKDAIIDDTLGYEFLPLVPEKYKVLSRVGIDVYVDPKTGTIVNYKDSGVSYYADSKNNAVWDIAQWSNKYNEPTIADRVKEAQQKIKNNLIFTIIIPVVISLVALGLLTAWLVTNSKKRR